MSFRHRFPLLRALLLVFLLAGSGMSPLAASAADPAAEAPSPQARIGQAERALQAVRRSLDDADAPETLRTLSEQALQAKRDADAAVAALVPQLEQIDARIAQLGPLDDGATEERSITRQRNALDQQRSQVDADVKRGKLLAEDARQLSDSIEKARSQQIGEQFGRKVGSPLSPALWRQFAGSLPDDLTRIQGLYRQAAGGLETAVAAHGWSSPLLGAALALLMVFPLRLWLRHLGRRYAASDHAPAGRLRRSGLAVWLLLVGTLLPGFAAVVMVASLHGISAIPPRLESVADKFIWVTFVSAFIAALAACLLVPHRPSWRLLNIDDTAALRLRNPDGCAHCRRAVLPELFGYDGRTVAAECLEPGLPGADGGNGHVPDPRTSAMAHAMEKAVAGLVDPRDVEVRFMAFETLLLRQGRLPSGDAAPRRTGAGR